MKVVKQSRTPELRPEGTPVGNFRTFSVSREVDVNTNPTDAAVVAFIGTGKHVLELGCGSGHMSRILSDRDCTVVGIEIDRPAAEAAAEHCRRVITADLDYLDFDNEIGADRFDVIVAADVLEHLKDPVSVLKTLRQFLNPQGYLVTSIPNVAHLSVRLALLQGRFPYSETGLLDRTHLRFFTLESIERIFDDAGFVIGQIHRTQQLPADPASFEVPYDTSTIPAGILERLSHEPEASTYQFVIAAYPAGESGAIFLRDRIKQLNGEAERARTEVVELRRQLENSRGEVSQRERRIDELLTEMQSLTQLAAAAEAEGMALAAELERRCNTLARNTAEERDKAEQLRLRIAELQKDNVKKDEQIQKLHASSAEQKHCIDGLNAKVETLFTREKDLREMLLEAHDQLIRRDDEIAATLVTTLPQSPAPPATPQTDNAPATRLVPGKYSNYRELLKKIRELVQQAVPAGGNVLVISKGDDDLLKLGSCRGLHFPQRPDGVYAGYYPADAAAAIAHLQELRTKGANFLLIPQTSLWWLDHYAGFRDYLDQHFTRIIDQPDICVLFEFSSRKQHITSTTASEAKPFGVNISGHISSEKGVGEAVRATIRSLSTASVPLTLNDYPDGTSLNFDSEFTTFSEDNPFGVNLIQANADSLAIFVDWKGRAYLQGHYNIGYWFWENSVFPKEWWDRFQYLDEVWVGTDFVLDAVSRVSPVPVVKIPVALPSRLKLSSLSRADFGINRNSFVFVFSFDYMSIAERKNPLAAIRAFRKAFNNREDVVLVLKCGHSDAHMKEARRVTNACKGANIKIIDAILPREDVNALMNVADCYVSLHRSEGFGLTIAEAMSLEKPVITTAYSGNMDFTTPANSFLVKYKLVEIEKDHGPYVEGVWADPDVDHAAELMRHVVKNRELAREVGRRGRVDVLSLLNAERAGALMRDRLLRIAELGRIPIPPEFATRMPRPRAHEVSYREMVQRIRQTVETNVPLHSRLAVVNKGDTDLLNFNQRSGWHFPQTPDGQYAGYYPASSADAIQQLESLRGQGARYLLFPQTAFWWLDHYSEFKQHLEKNYPSLWRDTDCLIYSLCGQNKNGLSRLRDRVFGKR